MNDAEEIAETSADLVPVASRSESRKDLDPLAAAFIVELRADRAAVVGGLAELRQDFRAGIAEMRTEMREIRANPPFRWIGWVTLLLWILSMFVIGILALKQGVDPTISAKAVEVFVPQLPQ